VSDQSVVRFPRFYLTAPAACPYLPEKQERKVFTYLSGAMAPMVNDALTNMGFRRSQSIAYKPACDLCSACISVRVVVDGFKPGRTFRRITARGQDIRREVKPARANAEQYNLLKRYLLSRHASGGMADMGLFDYAAMIEDTPIHTQLIEYRRQGVLIAACLTDQLETGLSMVYSFYDPVMEDQSLGSYMVLDHIALAKSRSLPYVYLGYWIEQSRKMAYKIRFSPLEALGPNGWAALDASEKTD